MIEDELRAAGTPERAEHEKRYLKSELEHFGTSVPDTRKIVRRHAKGITREDALATAEALWARPVHECRLAAAILLSHAPLEPEDIALVERLLREARTWALVDVLATSVAAPLTEDHPEPLDRWAQDEDFWIRRSALLALLPALRRGEGDFERFSRYADAMLEEKEFFVRKAIGWVLRDTSRKRPDLVADWIEPRADRASGLTVREATKRLDPERGERIRRRDRAAARSRPRG